MSEPKTNTAVVISLNGADVICNADGTALFDKGRMLVVSDLHLEKGKALSGTAALPHYDTDDTLAGLEAAVKTHQPERILFLGDSFHRSHLAEELGQEYRNRIEAMATGREMIWIIGNHDPALPDFLPGVACPDYVTGGIWFRHIAQDPKDGPLHGGEVSGHYHPKVKIKTRARGVSGKCFIHDGMRLMMPAFGAYTGGLSVFNTAIARHFKEATPDRAKAAGAEGAEILFCHACQIYRYPYSQVIRNS